MKKIFLLPLLALTLFTACSEKEADEVTPAKVKTYETPEEKYNMLVNKWWVRNRVIDKEGTIEVDSFYFDTKTNILYSNRYTPSVTFPCTFTVENYTRITIAYSVRPELTPCVYFIDEINESKANLDRRITGHYDLGNLESLYR